MGLINPCKAANQASCIFAAATTFFHFRTAARAGLVADQHLFSSHSAQALRERAREDVEPRALTLLVAQPLQAGHDELSLWPGKTSVSDLCHTGWSPAVSTLKPYS